MGYTPMQFMLGCGIQFMALVFAMMLGPILYLAFIVLFIAFIMISRKLDKENKKGNPDYLSSWQVWGGIRKSFYDESSIMGYIKPVQRTGKKNTLKR